MITIPPAADESGAPVPLEPDSASTATLSNTEATEAKTEERRERMPLVWIPATLCVGLLIAAVYLGGRIVTAHSSPAPVRTKPLVTTAAPIATQAAPIVTPAAPVVTQAAPVEAQVKAKAEPKPEAPKQAKPAAPQQAKSEQAKSEPARPKQVTGDPVPMIAPKDGERYIQVGALDLERTRRYIGHLREAKLEPHVAPGPTPEMLRILIGPFADRDSLASIKSQLDSAGIDNFVREY
jgi:cell division septation protein DedD